MASCKNCGEVTDCPKCGEPLHDNLGQKLKELAEAVEAGSVKHGPDALVQAAALRVEALHDWRKAVKPETAAKIDQQAFKVVKGEGFRTLFVSAIARVSAVYNELDLANEVRSVFASEIAPVLDTVNENCEVLGHLATPSTIKLAITDLSLPAAAFCFVTVKDTPELEAKLDSLGLGAILRGEGMVATVGSESPHRTLFVK